MLRSKISSKGRLTLPRKVREALGVVPGDLVEYELRGKIVLMRRAEPFDRAFHRALADSLAEWLSTEDEAAFRDL